MSCNGITREDYFLWSLGLLEDSDAELIRTHLTSGCETCTEAVRASLDFWALFGAAAGLDASPTPSPRVRAQLLESIESARSRSYKLLLPSQPRFVYAAILAATLLVVVTVGLQFGRRREAPNFPSVQTNNGQLDTVTQRIADLQNRLDASERELERLRAVSSNPILPVPALLPKSSISDDTAELDRALSDANQQIQQLRAALSGEQARSARLAQELEMQTTAMAASVRERRDADVNLAAANGRLAERDRQIKALDSKVVQLEHERDRLKDALSNQQRRIEHTTRLVALLSSPRTKFVRLAGTEAAPGATGYVILAEGTKLIFTGANLPGLRPGRVYQLWLMRGRSPGIVSAGTFEPRGEEATLEFGDASLLNDVRGLAVTEEPTGGNPLPTGHKLLIGTTKS